jgi:aspartate aminotransferase
MTLALSQLARNIKPSATLAAGAKARQLKAEGLHVYDFSLGEPDFRTPEHICQAAVKAMQQGHTRYTPANGIPELRTAVAKHYQRTYGIAYTADEVVISSGAKHSIYNVLAALVGPGDEVLIPSPYWVSYSDMVEMTGARYRLIPTTLESGFKMSAEQLRNNLSPRARLLMLNSPSNPTGATYTRGELKAIADVVIEAGLAVMSDEIYERLIYGDAHATCFATLHPQLKDRTVTVSGASKTYAMTGWRMGWACGPASVIKAIGNVQSQQTGNPCSISQYATITALEGDQSCVEVMRKEFEARRNLVVRRLNAISGIRCRVPEGAFYAFFDVSSHFGRTLGGKRIEDSAAFCQAALEQAHVNLVQGAAFGAEGFARLSFATSREELNQGLDALDRWLRG